MAHEMRAGSCGHCGAPLPLPTAGVVICGYCGRQYQVAVPAPAPAPAPLPQALPSRSSGAHKVLLVLALLLVLGVTGAAALMQLVRATASSGAPAGARRASGSTTRVDNDAPRWWYSRSEPALTRGTAEAPHVVGMVGWLDGTTHLTSLDGASGKLSWHVAAPRNIDVYADGGDLILAYDPAKRVIRYDAQSGKELWSITVADYVHDITFGAGCASLRFGKPLGIDALNGSPKDCVPTRVARLGVEKGQLRDFTARRGDVDLVGATQLDSKPVNPEPPRFLITGSRAGRELWRVVPTTLEPIWTFEGFHRSLLLTPPGLFVFGRNGADHHVRLLLLDPMSGRILYGAQHASKVDDTPWLVASGSFIYVNHDKRLEAYAASTGKLVWQIAER